MNRSALDSLFELMKKMKEWEADFCTAQDNADEDDLDISAVRDEYATKLKEILDCHSLDQGLNKERLVDLGSTIPVTYDPCRDEVLLENGSDAIYIVKQAVGFKSVFRFSMILKGENWLVQKKERLNESGKWVASTI